MGNLYLTSSGGSIFNYNIKSGEIVKEYQTINSNEYLMGITFSKKDLYFSSNYNIYQYQIDKNLINILSTTNLGNMMIQHIKCIGDYIFAPCLSDNSLLVIDIRDFTKVQYYIHFIPTARKTYGDYISSITFIKGKFLIQFCSVRGGTTNAGSEADFPRTSGIIIMNTNLEIVTRATNGMEVVLTKYIDGKLYSICNYNEPENGNGALLVGGIPKVVWSDEFTIYDVAIDSDNIFLVGRMLRKNDYCLGGILLHLDREFNLIDTKFFDGLGYFLGCSSSEDKTNQYEISNDDINIDNWQEKKVDSVDNIITVREG